MKKTILFLFLLAMIPALMVTAQGRKKKKAQAEENTLPPPKVWVGNIRTYYTCRDSILAKPMLVTDSPGCRVSGFTISLMAPGHDFYGPLHVNGWEFSDVQKETIKKWDYKDVTFYVQDIHLNCHETDATSPPFQLKFDH